MYTSYVAIGDSFTEGVGDVLPDGRVRGWADLVAVGLGAAADEPVRYANLAIRGRKLGPIVGEQLDAAIAMSPQLLSINGGGNDIMRPRVSIDDIAEKTARAVGKAADAGIHVLLLSGANPSDNLPGGRSVQRRGDELAVRVRAFVREVTAAEGGLTEQLMLCDRIRQELGLPTVLVDPPSHDEAGTAIVAGRATLVEGLPTLLGGGWRQR